MNCPVSLDIMDPEKVLKAIRVARMKAIEREEMKDKEDTA